MRNSKLLIVLWLFYVAALSTLAFWPSPVDHNFSGVLNQSIKEINQLIGFRLLSYALVEFLANILLFIPLGMLVRATHKFNALMLLAVSIAGILCIELFQRILLEQRYASALDLLANSLGVLLGFFLTGRLLKFTEKTQPRG